MISISMSVGRDSGNGRQQSAQEFRSEARRKQSHVVEDYGHLTIARCRLMRKMCIFMLGAFISETN